MSVLAPTLNLNTHFLNDILILYEFHCLYDVSESLPSVFGKKNLKCVLHPCVIFQHELSRIVIN